MTWFKVLSVTISYLVLAVMFAGCTGTAPTIPTPTPTPTPIVAPLEMLVWSNAQSGIQGQSFVRQLPAAGGIPPYTWILVSGTPPPGLSLTSNGRIVGTPTSTGTFTYRLKLTDSKGASVESDMTQKIDASGTFQFVLLWSQISSYVENQVVGYVPFAQGGKLPWTFTVSGLPEGVAFDPATSLICGTTTSATALPITVSLKDADGREASGSPLMVSFQVNPPKLVTSPAPQAKSVIPLTIDTRWHPMRAYIIVETNGAIHYQVTPQTLMAYGGSPFSRYTWSKTTGTVGFPFGITVDLNGVFRGTGGALIEGAHTFSVDVSDGSSTNTATFSITVGKYVKQPGTIPDPGPPFVIFEQAQGMPTIPLVDSRAGQSYAASLYVAGGEPPYSWFVDPTYQSNFALSGLTIDMGGGIVRGTISPTMSGQTIKFTVIVRDSTGDTAIPGPIYTINVR